MKQPSDDPRRLNRLHCRPAGHLLGLSLSFVLLLPTLLSAAPANDTCTGAIQLPAKAPFQTAVLDISTATLTGDPPVPDFYTNKLSRSVWFRFTPVANGLYTISTCAGLTETTINDTVMGLFTSSGGCSGPFVQVAFEDENCNSQAEISASLLADTSYYIVVWKYFDGSPDDGENNLQLSVTGRVTPSNDRCGGALPLRLNVPAFGTTAGSADDYHIDAPSAFTGIGQVVSTGPGREVVYSFTAPAAGSYSVKLWNADVTEDILLYAAPSCPSGPLPATVSGLLAAANRSRVSSSEEIFCLSMTAGQNVMIFVDHVEAANNGGSFVLEVTRCQTESEPNDSMETASPLVCGIEGSIGGNGAGAGDLDFYSLGSFPPDWRAFILLDGEASHNSDFDLRIVNTNATLEFDDNNNDTLFADSSPNIAGAPLPGGPVYVLVNFNGPLEAEPYRIYGVVQPPLSAAQMEAEPNNTTELANAGALNYYRGTLDPATPGDEDIYAFNVDEGDLFFVSLDGDPLRNNSPLNARLELIDAFGNILFTVNDGALSSNTNQSPGTVSGRSPFSPGEGFIYRFAEEGTFYVRVSASPTAVGSVASGDYLLSISRNCRTVARFIDITPGPGPQIRLRLQGSPGGTYRVEKADTFGSWSELGVRTVDASGLFEIDDTAPTASSRFYRAVLVQ